MIATPGDCQQDGASMSTGLPCLRHPLHACAVLENAPPESCSGTAGTESRCETVEEKDEMGWDGMGWDRMREVGPEQEQGSSAEAVRPSHGQGEARLWPNHVRGNSKQDGGKAV